MMHDRIESRRLLTGARHRSRQGGVIAPLAAVAMLALLAVAGLATDASFVVLNKSRLQNIADSAALNAAKIVDDGGDQTDAENGVASSLTYSAGMAGNGLFSKDLRANILSVTTEFSETLDPFTDGSTGDEPFVRVTLTGFTLPTFLLRVLGRNNFIVSASAVAGPSPKINYNLCDVAPFIICPHGQSVPDDCSDTGGEAWHGYNPKDVMVLKYGATQNSGDLEGGNYHLAQLPGASGCADVRDEAAGGSVPECISAGLSDLGTEPGRRALQELLTGRTRLV